MPLDLTAAASRATSDPQKAVDLGWRSVCTASQDMHAKLDPKGFIRHGPLGVNVDEINQLLKLGLVDQNFVDTAQQLWESFRGAWDEKAVVSRKQAADFLTAAQLLGDAVVDLKAA